MKAHAAGISVFAVGIGEGIQVDEIRTIASYPSSFFAYAVEHYDDLVNALLERLSIKFCEVSSFLSVNKFCFNFLEVYCKKYFIDVCV